MSRIFNLACFSEKRKKVCPFKRSSRQSNEMRELERELQDIYYTVARVRMVCVEKSFASAVIVENRWGPLDSSVLYELRQRKLWVHTEKFLLANSKYQSGKIRKGDSPKFNVSSIQISLPAQIVFRYQIRSTMKPDNFQIRMYCFLDKVEKFVVSEQCFQNSLVCFKHEWYT